MKNRLFNFLLGSAAVLSLAGTAVVGSTGAYAGLLAQTNGTPTPTQTFADPAFQKVWERTDRPVAFGQVGRSWFWGPTPRQVVMEGYAQGPNGQHKVQYFDKSRMEINNPNGDPNSAFYVTNGLLTVELMSGRMQTGDASFEDRYPANINIAGDNDDTNAPTYASFRAVANVAPGVGRRDSNRQGQAVTATINRAGQVGDDATKNTVAGVKVAYYESTTGHNIPEVFWNFLNQSGQVYKDGQLVSEQLISPWFYASGYPVSDPYWGKVKIGTSSVDVLIQAFERRVLTFNPGNAPAFQVEMGNIGLHYYDWRYNNAGQPAGGVATGTAVASGTAVATGTAATATGTAVASGTATTATTTATTTGTAGPTSTPAPLTGKIAFVSERSGNADIWQMNADGTVPQNLTNNASKDVDPRWSPDGTNLVFASDRVNGVFHIFMMNASTMSVTQVTTGTATDTEPAWSPDSQRIAFVSNSTGNNDIWTVKTDGTGLTNITQLPGNDRDPAWAPNNKILFVTDRSGSDHIYTMSPDGTAVTQLTKNGPKNLLPNWSPDGKAITYISEPPGTGNQEVYVMDAEGTNPIRLTDALSVEWDPIYSPDNRRIAYASDRDGNLEIYIIDAKDGTNLRRLTTDPAKDYHPTWKP